jgi:competence protein ComEC
MKLPALAITTAFALGIACGLNAEIVHRSNSRAFIALLLFSAAASLLVGIVFALGSRLVVAGSASLLCWGMLGMIGVCIEEQPRRADHILSLVDAGKINLESPLRYYGRLADEPENLPWGVGYNIELSGVDREGVFVPASGGLRLGYIARTDGGAPVAVRAGDSIAVLTRAKLPQVYRDEGAFDKRAYLSQQGVDLVGALRAPELLELVGPARASMFAWVSRGRRRLRDEVDELWSKDASVAGVLRAMLLGDRSFVDRDEARDFQKTGAFHVLVVAGLHVGAIAVVLFWVGRKLRWARVWTMALTLLLLLAYVTVVEQRTPVIRAALMAAIVVLGGFFFRRLELLNSAAIAALLMLVARPTALGDSSFQLSFLAIGCIAGLALPWMEGTVQPYARALRGWRDVTRDVSYEPRPTQFRIDLRLLAQAMETRSRWPARIRKVPGSSLIVGIALSFRVWELFVLTLVLQVGMLPLLASEFHRVTFAGTFVNFAAVPLTAIIVPLGFCTLIAGLLWPALGKILAWPVSLATSGLLHVVQRFALLRKLSYRIPGPPLWATIIFLITLAAIVMCLRLGFTRRTAVIWSLLGVLAAAGMVIAIYPFSPQMSGGKLELTVLDVGQGDSLFVVSPGGKTLLIDGGGAFGGFPGHEQAQGSDPGEEAVSPYLWSRRFQKIDVVALTHAHQDHLGGLNAILENFRVGQLWIGRELNNPALAKLEALASERHIPVEYEARGKQFSLDEVRGEFLWPENSISDSGVAGKNNDSLVLRLKYRNRTLLLPGDAEKQAEHTMLQENSAELRADVLKVGHHGSKNSTIQEFLDAVAPTIAIISSGEDNPYGHPSPELLERLEASGARVLRTDHDGAVHILTDGNGLEISCFVACAKLATVTTSKRAETPNQNQNNQ